WRERLPHHPRNREQHHRAFRSSTAPGRRPAGAATYRHAIRDAVAGDDGRLPAWQAKQDHMATLSTNSLHRHASATHQSLLDDEADAAVASKAIHDVVVRVRTSHPL